MTPSRRWLLPLVLFALLSSAPAWPQDAAPRSAEIGALTIDGLSPFRVSFDLRNAGSSPLENARGRATLTDRAENVLNAIIVEPFTVASGETRRVTAASRWEFQKVGIYVLQVTLDLGPSGLVSASLPFRIIPITLPLEPPQTFEGEGLYTVVQEPLNWGVSRIRAPLAWQTTHGSPSVTVAVIDSGIDTRIPQLAANLWVNKDEIPGNGIDDDRNGYVDDVNGWDFRDEDASSLTGTPIHWHGTFTASIIAARPGPNAAVGIAPGVRLMDLRFLDSKNLFYTNDWGKLARAVDYAVKNGAQIINLSIYASFKPPTVVEDSLRRAAQKSVIVVGIAGNDATPQVSYPGKYASVLAVSATTETGQFAPFSNYGAEVLLAAPGDRITALLPGGTSGTRSGTSFAAPHVAGALALLLSLAPPVSPAEAIAALEASAVDLGGTGRDPRFGYGMIDVAAAFERLRR